MEQEIRRKVKLGKCREEKEPKPDTETKKMIAKEPNLTKFGMTKTITETNKRYNYDARRYF